MFKLFNRKYKPPKKIVIDDIRTAQIMTLWSYIKPTPSHCNIGDKVTIPMKSGKTGLYELIDIDWSTHWSSDVDWEWYVLRFIGYR